MEILIVEDEKPLLDAISIKLTKSGFTAITARTCEDAITALHAHPHIRAIWLDHYLMGQETGLDFIGKAKQLLEAHHVPIFVVTNTGGTEKQQTYLRLGASRYYIKSNHRLDEIILDIKKYVQRKAIHETKYI